MSTTAMEAARLLDMLPESEQSFAVEFIKKLVLAWDPDYTRLTPEEAARLEQAEKSGFVAEEEINWAEIGQ